MRNLILVLGDQLSIDNPVLAGIDRKRDSIVMIEAAGKATYVWSHQARITLFLSAMRHFAELLRQQGLPLDYIAIDDQPGSGPTLPARLRAAIAAHHPQQVLVCEPGEYRVRKDIEHVCREAGVALEIRHDCHFLCDREEFATMMSPYYSPYEPEFYETQYQLIKSKGVAQKVVTMLSLETTYGSILGTVKNCLVKKGIQKKPISLLILSAEDWSLPLSRTARL